MLLKAGLAAVMNRDAALPLSTEPYDGFIFCYISNGTGKYKSRPLNGFVDWLRTAVNKKNA